MTRKCVGVILSARVWVSKKHQHNQFNNIAVFSDFWKFVKTRIIFGEKKTLKNILMIKKYNTVMKVRMTEEDLMELEPPSSPGYYLTYIH